MAEISPMRNRKPRQWCAGCGCCFGTGSPCRAREKRSWRDEVDEILSDPTLLMSPAAQDEAARRLMQELDEEAMRDLLLEQTPDPFGGFIRAESGVYDTDFGMIGTRHG